MACFGDGLAKVKMSDEEVELFEMLEILYPGDVFAQFEDEKVAAAREVIESRNRVVARRSSC
jgi:hypothetical protein